MPRADAGQAGMVADTLWRALRPYAIELLGMALAWQDGADGPDGDAELTADEQARVDAAVSRFRQRSRQPARQGRSAGPSREAKQGSRGARLTPKGGEP